VICWELIEITELASWLIDAGVPDHAMTAEALNPASR
jgi:hypothetical protein